MGDSFESCHICDDHQQTKKKLTILQGENITSSSFLAYSFLISKTNSTAPGFTKSGGTSDTLVTAMEVALLLWIA